MLIFVLVIGGLFGGWFTPTEAAGVGAALVLILSLVTRHMSWGGFKDSLLSTTQHHGHDPDHRGGCRHI